MAKQQSKDEVVLAVEEKNKYDKEQLLTIFDTIMFEGEYREDVLLKNKLKVTFRTRSAADTSAITSSLDEKKFNLMSSMQEYKALLCICYSITTYNNKDISTLSLEDKIKFIGKLPSVVVSALSSALVEFDLKTEAALEEQDAF